MYTVIRKEIIQDGLKRDKMHVKGTQETVKNDENLVE